MGLREALLAWPAYRLAPTWLRMPVLALAAVVVDLVIEPFAWQVRGYWLWSGGGLYYDVPSQNFLGWFLTALLLGGLTEPLLREGRARSSDRSGRSLAPPVLAVVLLSFVVGLAGGGYAGPVLLGLVLVGWTVLSVMRIR
jgi:putative membrane protein